MMKKAILLVVSGLAVSVFSSCGSSSNDGPTPVVTPTPAPVTTSLYSIGTSVPAAPAGGFVYTPNGIDVNVPYAGTVTASFDWTFTTSDIDMVVTRNDCTDYVGVLTRTCTVLGSDVSARKPASVTFTMTSAGVIRIWLFSYATVPESGVLNVTIVH
jgi:hypothetical protein